MVKYLELDSETLDIVSGPFMAPELPVFAEGHPTVAKEVLSMPDDYIIIGQIWDDATSTVLDTQESINKKMRIALVASDWKVIRELERMFLADTPLSVQREEYRKAVME